MNFESQNLKFSPLSLEHADFYYLMESDPEVLKYYRREVARDLEESQKNLKAYTDYSSENPGFGAMIVSHKESGNLIGLAVVIHLDKNPANKEIEIGYRLPVHNWGKGYATEIAKALVNYVFHSLSYKEVYGTTHPDNLASQKVLLKAGFELVGEGTYHGGLNKVFKLVK